MLGRAGEEMRARPLGGLSGCSVEGSLLPVEPSGVGRLIQSEWRWVWKVYQRAVTNSVASFLRDMALIYSCRTFFSFLIPFCKSQKSSAWSGGTGTVALSQ